MTGFSARVRRRVRRALREKDYEAECEILQQLFLEHANGEIRSVLDLGCGTANHDVCLAALGYDVVGVERLPRVQTVQTFLKIVLAGGATANFDDIAKATGVSQAAVSRNIKKMGRRAQTDRRIRSNSC